MKNRASRWPLILLATLAIVCALGLVVGCERKAATDASGSTTTSPDQSAQALQEIKAYQQENGKSLQELLESMKRQQELQATQAGDPPLVRDLAAARFFLSDCQKAADAKNAESLAAALRPLKRVLTAMAAELPGTLIAQHVDRASYLIRNQQAIGSRELTVASPELSAASDASINGRPAAVVPDVLNDIKSAKAAVGKGDAAGALQALQSALAGIGKDTLAGTMARALASIRGAEDTLGRFAWPVVSAELGELDSILTELSKTIAPQTLPAEKPATTETAPATGAATSAVPGAATSAVPPAVETTTQPVAPATTPPATQSVAPAAVQPAAQPTAQPALR